MLFKMNRLILILCLVFLSVAGYSQVKIEKEERIKKSEVPKNAILFVDSMRLPSRIKWFRETGYNKLSFEAKTKINGKKHSIEFSEDGFFEDLEVEIEKECIPQAAINKITDYLSKTHTKYKIDKVQVQYLGDTNLISKFIETEILDNGIIVNYELVVIAKVDGTFDKYEYLFDKNGEFIQKTKIINRMTENIEF